jgi:hypothetical protein
MLGFAKMDMFGADPYWRKPQPSTWDEIVRQRDGANSLELPSSFIAPPNLMRLAQSPTPAHVKFSSRSYLPQKT